jgi:hypothetical protein
MENQNLHQEETSRRRGWSPRALVIGSLLAALIAVLTPINSLAFGNSMLFGSYLPPVAVVLVTALVWVVNPLLGARRLLRGELVTILVLVTCLGGVVGQGLMRSIPGFFVGPATTLPRQVAADQLVEERALDERALLDLASQVLARFDRNADGVVAAGELLALGPALDPAASLDQPGLAAALAPPTEAYRFPTWLMVGVPERGRVEPARSEQQRLVGGYQDGLDSVREAGRVGYGDALRLRSGAEVQIWWLLSGADRDAALRSGRGVADPRAHPAARSLLRSRVGTTVAFAGRDWELVAIQAAGVPWAAWWWTLLAWSPLLLGAILAMVALSGIVRHQWLVGERLTFPVARVLGSLTDERGTGIWRHRGLWTAAGLVLFIHVWRTAYAAGWMPIDITTTLQLGGVIPGDSWLSKAPYLRELGTWHLWFTVVAMTFLITPEVGFSLWGSFVGVNLVCALLISGGMQIDRGDLGATAIGGGGVLALVLLWVGRDHYLGVVRAALRIGNAAPEAKAAAPYLWLLLLGCAGMLGFMLAAGLGLGASVFVVLALLLTTVVLARAVAEAGVPYASLAQAGRVGELAMLWVGPAVPVAGLLPLAMLGYVLGNGDRERIMAHALNAQAIDAEHGKSGQHRISGLVIWSAVIGIAGAFLGMLLAGYFGGGAIAGDGFAQAVWGRADWRVGQQLGPGGEAMVVERRGATTGAYIAGAVVVLVISLGRLRFAAWPLHPIGFILLTGWVTTVCWFSYVVGWLLKVLVLRYGVTQLYQRLVPVAIGLVLGDALAIVGVMVLRIGTHLAGVEFPDFTILPK